MKRARPYDVSVREELLSIPLRDFCDCLDQCGMGIVHLSIRVPSRPDKQGSPVAQVCIESVCKHCDFTSVVEQEMLKHIASSHLGKFFRPLTYAEHRGRNPSLPEKIFICPREDFKFAGNGREGVMAIEEHIKRNRHFVEGRMRYREVFDVEEIRRILPDLVLPQVSKCLVRSCDWIGENLTEAEKMRHLLEDHKQELYEIG
jgi:hypothetical protein